MIVSLFTQFLFWFFIAAPKSYLVVWKNFLSFLAAYFSFGAVIKTLCSPWKGIRWQRQHRGLDPGDIVSTFFSNLISRGLGAIMRTFLLVTGILSEAVFFLTGLILFFAWFAVPILIILGFFYGFALLLF